MNFLSQKQMIKTPKHLAYTLKVNKEEMLLIAENLIPFYYEKKEFKYKKSGELKKDLSGKPKLRILHPSLKHLKLIQKRILTNILQSLNTPSYIYGGVKKKDNVMNAEYHKGKKFIFTTDLRNFFPSINYKMVYKMFVKHGFSPTVSNILTKLTTYKGKVPQGTPTSSMIANLVLVNEIGEELEVFAKEHNIYFTTFVDDLTFSSPIDFKSTVPTIIEIINKSFKISHDKTNYKTKKPIVTGVVVKNNYIEVPDSFKEKLNNTTGKSKDQINGLRQYKNKVSNRN